MCPGCNIEIKTYNRLTLFNKYSIPRSSSNMAFLTVRLSSLLLTSILSLNLSSLQLPSIHLTSLQLTSILLCILLSSLQVATNFHSFSLFLFPSCNSLNSFYHYSARVLSPLPVTPGPFSASHYSESFLRPQYGPFSTPKYPRSFLHP